MSHSPILASKQDLGPHPSYTSVRVTRPHSDADTLATCFKGVEPWVMFPELGKSGNNPHFHVVFPGIDKAVYERIRTRIKTAFPGKQGNSLCTVTKWTNGILQGIQYISKEGKDPHVSCVEAHHLVHSAPAWVNHDITSTTTEATPKPKRERLGDPMLTLSNLIKQAVRVARARGIDSLPKAIAHLIYEESWVPSRDILRGVPLDYHRIFRHRMAKRPDVHTTVAPPSWAYPHDTDRPWPAHEFLGNPVGHQKVWSDHVFKSTPE